MRRAVALLLCLSLTFTLLALAGCGRKETVYTREGDTLLSPEGGTYTLLDIAFEAGGRGSECGSYTDVRGETRTLYEIPGLDASRFLTDGDANVYCAGEVPDPAALTLTAMLFCEGEAISVAVGRLTAAKDGEILAALRTAWFEGEAADRPIDAPTAAYRLKMASSDYPNLYYCVGCSRYADGAVYLNDPAAGRTVRLSDELSAQLPIA